MAIVFSAILPHSPLLVPNIGKTNQMLFTATLAASQIITENLKAHQPDIVIIITPTGAKRNTGFVFNIAPKFTSDLSDFGDLVTRWQFTGNLKLSAHIRETLEGQTSIQILSNPELDYASAITLSLAGIHETTPILPVSTSRDSLTDHYSFGEKLQTSLLETPQKIAILASADFSHRLTKNSPAGYLAKAKKIDKKIIDLIITGKVNDILALTPRQLEEVAIEDMGPVAMLLGMIKEFDWTPRLLSYESPFGVSHAVIGYNLSL